MGDILSEVVLSRLSEFVAANLGLHFPRDRWGDLQRGLVAASRQLDFRDAGSCLDWLTTSPLTRKQIEVLASHLTVGETYFFRDRKTFQLLEEQILPPLIQARRDANRRLRIWSAGCATGEEAYSVAILLGRLLPDLASWHVTILATDINPQSLEKARAGIYGPWSFRDGADSILKTHFDSLPGRRFRIAPEVRRLVEFEYLNLAEDAYPSLLTNTNAMDVILCRNVLMYFSFQQARRTVERLHQSLVDDGWLLVSPSEASHLLFSQFSTVAFPDAILYRKAAGSTSPVIWTPHEEPQVPQPLPFTYEPVPPPEASTLPAEEAAGPLPANSVEERQQSADSGGFQEALALCARGRYEEAAEALLALLEEHPADAEAMVLLARACANQGRLEEARTWCERAIRTDKLRATFHYLRAMILQEQGDEARATEALRHALYLDPDFILAHVALGNLRRRQGRPRDSRKHFQNALGLLRARPAEELVAESEGMTSGRMVEIIQLTV
jgi:chemotaxis protein methyltransferase CheR